jgi:hypothetical protein
MQFGDRDVSFFKNDSESNFSSSKNLILAEVKKQERKINGFFGIDKVGTTDL